MKKLKRAATALLAAVLLAMSLSTFAAESGAGFADVSADAWYASAVEYVQDKGLMSGTSANTFAPDAATSRAMLATILYRASGNPAVSGAPAFTDVTPGAWYADAVAWAADNGIVSGYGNGLFGSDDPISREQIAAILWRYAGSPAADAGEDFADEAAISAYASTAVDWARANGIINGKEGNRFDPNDSATRAQVATILRNYMTLEPAQTPDTTETPDITETPDVSTGGSNVLVVYYSATGSTEAVAQTIASPLGGDLFELIPTDPYTSADLNWTADGSRVNREHDNEALRDIALTSATVENWADYDTVFIGYPIWWGIAAWPVNTFITANDFTGKTVIPFATSSSSGLGESGELLADLAGTGEWLEGRRFNSRVAEANVVEWVEGLGLASPETANAPSGDTASLVVYFSMPETTDPNNMTTEEDNSAVVIDGQVLGNTQYMAYVIQETVGADIFRIEPATPYPTDHDTLVDLAAEEQNENARPALAAAVEKMDRYDVIYLGYPNWWGDMPMILYTFLEEHDLSGKTIVPFNTHGGSGFSHTIDTLRTLEPDAQVLDGLSISRNAIQDARQDIVDWVTGLEL